ncbi:DUF4345 domain-containing protein [Azospirillum doebereinerae]|uniref:DUF4345 domain-containing protein n=1 Tax=Azospirillum doebereinerae TaxID=92933 RepID=UPI001EE4FB8B|nr:DUF4345 domain-containing protein [Azospirillum doebereinerae]MCG5239659.1 DUF4345 domain-containing protein [Azospirillum doebereinerae]
MERRFLQVVVALLSLVPLSAGAAGVLLGPGFVFPTLAVDADPAHIADLDSHFRYLSGIFLGVGLLFVSTVPTIERSTGRFRLAAALVVVGGLARALSLAQTGAPSAPHLAGLGLELVVTPLLVLWQARVAAKR